MPKQGYVKMSFRLGRRIKDLKIMEQGAWEAAFMDTYDLMLPQAKKLFKKNVLEAIVATKEFDHPLFLQPLLAILEIDALYIIIPDEAHKKVRAVIDMNEHAGNTDDYFGAVAIARSMGGFGGGEDIEKASYFWKTMLYRPAREGLRTGGEKKRRQLIRAYWNTISLRVEAFVGKAPWWELVDKGNNATAGLQGAGQPYPRYNGQKFVDKSERTIEALFTDEIRIVHQEYLNRIDNEGVNSEEVADKISKIVTEVTQNPGEYFAGDILLAIEDRGRKYKLYISRTGQLGYALRPDFRVR